MLRISAGTRTLFYFDAFFCTKTVLKLFCYNAFLFDLKIKFCFSAKRGLRFGLEDSSSPSNKQAQQDLFESFCKTRSVADIETRTADIETRSVDIETRLYLKVQSSFKK